MTHTTKVGIAGLGSYVPDRVMTNADIEKLVDTSDDWIVQRTGIKERRIAGPDQDSGAMGAIAAQRALDDAGVDASEVDLILCGTTTPDKPFPTTACHIQDAIGAKNAGGFDINSACTGFVFAFNTGAQFVASGAYKNVLVIGTEKLSTITDWQDRNTCIIFGDAAGAMLLRPLDLAGQGELVGMSISTEGGKDDVLEVPAGGSRQPLGHEEIEQRLQYMRMGGNKVYKFAVSTFSRLVKKHVFTPYGIDDLGLVVPHQVNMRIIESAQERLGLPDEKIFNNIERYGNTASASVPLAFDEAYRTDRLVKGKLVMAPAFGAGLSWGHFLVRW